MSPDLVRPLHLRIADHVEASPGSATSAPETLAHHFWQACCHERATQNYELSGDSAMTSFRMQCGGLLRGAAQGFAGDSAARARVLAKAARALVFSGDLDGGLELYEHAVALHLELGQTVDVVRGRALIAGHLFDGGRRAAAIALLRGTLPLAQRDLALHSRLQTRLAMMLVRDFASRRRLGSLGSNRRRCARSRWRANEQYYLCASELHAVRGNPEMWRTCFARGIAIYETAGHPGPLPGSALQLRRSIARAQLKPSSHARINASPRTVAGCASPIAILLAQVELYAGNLGESRRLIESMPPSDRFLIRAMLAQVAIPLAIALRDDAMLARHLDESLLAGVKTARLRRRKRA